MRYKTSSLALLLACLLLAPAALAAEQWIHVKVESADDERVTVNLPISMVRSVAAMLPADVTTDIDAEMRVAIDDLDMEWQQLRDFWRSVQDAPEATFATVQTRDETFEVKKEGDYLLVQTTEATDTEINVQLPMAVVDALFSGPEGTLDFVAALDALASHGTGHLVSIRDGDETVKVWIDDRNLVD